VLWGWEDRVLELDRAAGGRHRRDDQRRDVARAERESSCRGGRTPADQRDATTGPRAATTRDADQLRKEAERPDRRRGRSQLSRDAAEVVAEALAARAVADVLAGIGGRPDAAVVGLDELLADHCAGGVARGRGLREPEPGSDEKRFDRADRDPERARQLGVRHPRQLAHQQRRALLLGELADVFDQPSQRLPEIDLRQRVVGARPHKVEHLGGRRRRPAELVDAAVVGDPEQPRSQRQVPVRRAQP
jgi:hypothetical protein